MRETYTVPENERENVLKLLARYGKKAAAYREAFYRKMRILLVENSCPAIDRTTETAWIIDKDDCEIYQG